MNEERNIPRPIREGIAADAHHVFIINSPIVLLVTCLAIARYNIPLSHVLVVPLRNMDCSILKASTIIKQPTKPNSLKSRLMRAAGREPIGAKIRDELETLSPYFLVYAFWSSLLVREVVQSKQCVGLIYLEEGEMAYRADRYRPLKLRLRSIRRLPYSIRENYHYSPRACGYIGLFPDAFCFAPEAKKWILQGHDSISHFYTPQLTDIKNIGLIPYGNIDVERARKFINYAATRVKGPICLKIHPAFESCSNMRSTIDKAIQTSTEPHRFVLAPMGTIVEAEMMLFPKTLIAQSASSLLRYAKNLNSSIIQVPNF